MAAERGRKLSDARGRHMFVSFLIAARPRHVPHGWQSPFSTVMNDRVRALGRPGDRAIVDLTRALGRD